MKMAFLWFLFILCTIAGGLLLFAILLDIFLFESRFFTLSAYLQCFAFNLVAVGFKIVINRYKNN